ncbi:TetR/AcrR family transcriptional regulator [Natronosporangium hydrolyticum]|uniref:TetR/AcrR family transcriptional regulator n=1 Tax=Natronosporangium hydrolyticum TaxID=2811111 RepID=A0A895YNY5_9ACTN|nr:TetR/AcrR family transcriptional regulator [Natronosporangium hydrolyticum]QSB15830.1 TetR/AcrR family transcriptional regulator [Natronosporangium hydrolyticum]
MCDTRDRLISAAAELLDQGGPAGVTLREVGRRAGVSHNAPYKHFADKRDLLAAIAAAELRGLADQIAAIAGYAGTARLEAVAHTYLAWAAARPARFKLTFGTWVGDHGELGSAATLATTALYNAVRLAQTEDRSLPSDTSRIVSLLWALAHGAVDLEAAGHLRKRADSPSADELVKALVAMLPYLPAGSSHRADPSR